MSLLDKTNLLITPNAVKAGKLYSVIPASGTGDCTVVRNTTATRINSAGLIVSVVANVPRLNYTLNTGGEGFILDEPQKTNLVLYSDQIDNAAWLKLSTASVVANSNVSPDGTSNADTLTFSTTLGSRIEQSINLSVAGDYTYSVYLRALAPKTIAFRTGISNSAIVNINVTTTWTRFIITQNLASAPNTGTPQLRSIDTAGGSVFVWGQQFELGSFATSYVPTVASAITRNADVITVAPPATTVKITTTFSNNTTQVITSIPATYTMPEGLIKQVLMQNSL